MMKTTLLLKVGNAKNVHHMSPNKQSNPKDNQNCIKLNYPKLILCILWFAFANSVANYCDACLADSKRNHIEKTANVHQSYLCCLLV